METKTINFINNQNYLKTQYFDKKLKIYIKFILITKMIVFLSLIGIIGSFIIYFFVINGLQNTYFKDNIFLISSLYMLIFYIYIFFYKTKNDLENILTDMNNREIGLYSSLKFSLFIYFLIGLSTTGLLIYSIFSYSGIYGYIFLVFLKIIGFMLIYYIFYILILLKYNFETYLEKPVSLISNNLFISNDTLKYLTLNNITSNN